MARRAGTLLAVLALTIGGLLSAGAVSAAGSNVLTAKLSGSHEVPAVASGGWGSARVVIQGDGSSIFYQVAYGGLSGALVAAHIHLGAIGANGPVALPLAIGPGSFSGTLTAANFTGANGLTFAAAVDAIRTGGGYINLHTAAHPAGEIRGQVYDGSLPQSYVISADAPEANPAGHAFAYNDYFPRTLTVVQGSIVSFAIKGFHTGTILPAGTTVAQDFAAGGSVAVDDLDDTVLNPNGTTHVLINIPALMPVLPSTTCGTAADPCSFDGTKVVSEGAPLGPPGAPTAIQMNAPQGTYAFHCRVHPAMIGWLTVVDHGHAGPSPDDVAAQAAAEIAADTSAALATFNAKNHADVKRNKDGSRTIILNLGAETPDHHVAILEMIPAKVEIGPNDHVQWRVSGRNEPHTVTFPKHLGTDQVPVCEGPNGTDVPCQGPPDEVEFGGGNGVTTITTPTTVSDSGLLMPAVTAQSYGVKATGALSSWRVNFANAAIGTYTFVCQIHDGMAGTIKVTQ